MSVHVVRFQPTDWESLAMDAPVVVPPAAVMLTPALKVGRSYRWMMLGRRTMPEHAVSTKRVRGRDLPGMVRLMLGYFPGDGRRKMSTLFRDGTDWSGVRE